jgi:serine protease Do
MIATLTNDPATAAGLSDEISAAVVQMIDRVKPSVVQVQGQGRGGGAGVIWRTDGAVLTNYHVVAGVPGKIQVLLPDGRKFDAKVGNYNATLDLALLHVEATDLPAVLVDDSSTLRIGELVAAVGHPWGQRNVVTLGIISGLGEVPVPGSRRSAQYIRSDVRVAPGNSGGPLLNARGAVVGITAMIFGGDMTVAIPSQVASDWVAGLPTRRVYLGVGVRPVELPIRLPRRGWARAAGLLVVNLDPGGPATQAGLAVGDVLVSAAGRPVVDGSDLLDVLAASTTSEPLQLHVVRDGAIREVAVPLVEQEPTS